jgi:hypothetical protein
MTARFQVSNAVIGLPLAITLAVALTAIVHGQDQAPASGRIEGHVTDAVGAVLTGVLVTLTAIDAGMRHASSGDDGRFVFEGVPPGARYSLLAELAGFSPDSARDIAVINGQTRTIDLELEVRCFDEQGIQVPDLDRLLAADAVAHVRVGDAGEDKNDGCGPTREAVVISAIHFTSAGQRIGETFRLMGAHRFERGKEYLLFLS